MRKISLLFLIVLIFASLAHSVLAQGRAVEVKYPEVGGYRPEEVTTPVPKYVQYIFNFAIWISGFVALVVLIIGGFQWFTSAGNLERIKEAKERISAALLGLVILFGSWLILTTINPELVVFHLPRLRPIISELAPGVLLCRKEVKTEAGDDAILKSWELVNEYKLSTPTEDREKEIQKELDLLLGKIALDCYYVQTAGDIRADYDNKVNLIYFVPALEIGVIEVEDPVRKKIIKQKTTKTTEYGAVVYEEQNFGGKSQVLARNLIDPHGTADAYVERILLKASSIKPFTLIYKPDPGWQVILYQEYNKNKGIEGLTPVYANITTNSDCQQEWWCEFALSWPPKSMEIAGDLFVILCKDKIQMGSCETFFGKVENNLEEYENIVEWVNCKSYQSGTNKQCKGIVAAPMGGAGEYTYQCCAKAAAKRMLIISVAPY